jgi:phenylacetate-CoA ligase
MIKEFLLYSRALRTKYYYQRFGINFFKFNSDKHLFDEEYLRDFSKKAEHNISHYYFSGGTTERPKKIPLSIKDLYSRAKYRALCYEKIGLNKDSKVAVLLPFGPWVAGPSAHLALRILGCTVFPLGLLKDENEICALFSIMEKHSIDSVVTTPSFVDMMIYVAEKNNINIEIKYIITSGEFFSKSIKDSAAKIFNSNSFSTYASSEAFIGFECKNQNGFHYNPKYLKVDLDNKKEKSGRFLFTVLDSDIVPIIKYPLGDIGKIYKGHCDCGINWPKLILEGRDKNIFGLSGAVNVFPYQIKGAIDKSNIKVSNIEVLLEDGLPGRDKVTFIIFTDKIPDDKKCLEIKNNIIDMSMDFADIYTQDLIDLNLHFILFDNKETKMKLFVNDKRKNAR